MRSYMIHCFFGEKISSNWIIISFKFLEKIKVRLLYSKVKSITLSFNIMYLLVF